MGILDLFRRREPELTPPVVDEHGVTGGLMGDGERHRFAEWLIERKLAERDHVVAALMEQRVTDERIGATLVRNGFMQQDALVHSILEFNPDRIATEKVTTSRIPVDILEAKSIIISADVRGTLYIGTMSDEAEVTDICKTYYPEKQVQFVAFLPELMPEFIERVRRTSSGVEDVRQEEIMERLLFRALKEGASDIHIEPKARSYSVFFRILGDRILIHEGGIDEYNIIAAQLKDRSRMDLAERRVNQDGGFQIEQSGKFIDLRVATVPDTEGEQIIVRVLDPERARPKLQDLGITEYKQWQRGVTRQNGLNLICGPTGSGKTTTLNASLRSFDRFGKKIYTIEDPVEYRIPGIGQVTANPQVGLDFARAVKAFMRADPDIIAVGEVRDAETARNAVKAADTGHLVIATLHTSSILSSLSRLRDLGVEAHELRFNLRAVLVQTLVKVVCRHCHGTGQDPEDAAKLCPVCHGGGYSDRTIVSECVSFSDFQSVDRIIAMTKPGAQFDGPLPWREMIDDAIDKMVAGQTTIDELIRVFGSYAIEKCEERGIDVMKHRLAKNEHTQLLLAA
ncbi:type II/IV secretion system family protein (plasmid) [Bosea sp. RAC05]|nr:type II/IV secretion system family protein [Bosea sp. RAC05]